MDGAQLRAGYPPVKRYLSRLFARVVRSATRIQFAERHRAYSERWHPHYALQEEALADTVAYIKERMPDAMIRQDAYGVLSYAARLAPDDGLIVEFGVRTGKTINHIANAFPDRRVFGFDSFEGLPEDWTGWVQEAGDLWWRGASQRVGQRRARQRPLRGHVARVLGKPPWAARACARGLRPLQLRQNCLGCARAQDPGGQHHRVQRVLQLSELARARVQSVSRVFALTMKSPTSICAGECTRSRCASRRARETPRRRCRTPSMTPRSTPWRWR